MAIQMRQCLLVILVAVFLGQTWLVYSDPAGRRWPPLSEQARRGRQVWHRHNCQSCHQLYGFGGFLGPDLTNLADRLPGGDVTGNSADDGEDGVGDAPRALAERLETVLTTGSARMPAFHLEGEDRLALAAFLHELGGTGIGQVQVRQAQPPRALFEELVGRIPAQVGSPGSPGSAEPPLGPLEEEGRRLVLLHGCIDCHLPNARSAFRATDLTRIHGTVDGTRVATVLAQGIPSKGMPRFGLGADEIEAVRAFLGLLETHAAPIRRAFENHERSSVGSFAGLPWFEYP